MVKKKRKYTKRNSKFWGEKPQNDSPILSALKGKKDVIALMKDLVNYNISDETKHTIVHVLVDEILNEK